MRSLTFITRILLVCLLLKQNLSAQEQLGLRLDNFSGVNAIMQNPAASATSQFAWDINIVGAGLWAGNNLFYLENTNARAVPKNPNSIGPNPSLGISFKGTPSVLANVYQPNDKHFISGGVRITGPSAVINLSNGHSFGFFTNVRAQGATFDLPKILNPRSIGNINLNQPIDVPAFNGSAMAWGEIGFNYGYTIGDEMDGVLAFGVNLKIEQGLQAMYFKNLNGTRGINAETMDTLRIEALRFEAGFTNNYIKNPTGIHGKGFGLDIGAMMTLPSNDDDTPYKMRLGASLTDLGGIRFGHMVEVHRIETKEATEFYASDFNITDGAQPHQDIVRVVNQKLFKPPFTSLSGNNFFMDLPTALQLQADYAVMKGVFVNAMLVQRIPMGNHSVLRDNLLAVTPRYESRWLGASMPVMVYNYKQMRVGLAARLAYLTIGTDHLLSWVGKRDLNGSDFYFALKVNPFNIGKIEKGRGGKKTECYRF